MSDLFMRQERETDDSSINDAKILNDINKNLTNFFELNNLIKISTSTFINKLNEEFLNQESFKTLFSCHEDDTKNSFIFNFQKNEAAPSDGKITKTSKKLRRIKRKTNFNKNFSNLREKLGLFNCSRKFQFDSLLKKVKSKIFKTIYDSLRTCLRENFRLQRLPQTFITDIKIDSNKCFIYKSVKEIYLDFGVKLEIDDLLSNDYIKKDKLEMFREFLSINFVEVYYLYMDSKQYSRDIVRIVKKEGDKFGELFKYIAKNFIDYYLFSKGNKPKKRCISKKIFKVIPLTNTKQKKKSHSKKENFGKKESDGDKNFD